jgi:hypothetical protein
MFSEAISNLHLVDQMQSILEYITHAFGFHSRVATSIFPPSLVPAVLVTPPREESLEEADRLLYIRDWG